MKFTHYLNVQTSINVGLALNIMAISINFLKVLRRINECFEIEGNESCA